MTSNGRLRSVSIRVVFEGVVPRPMTRALVIALLALILPATAAAQASRPARRAHTARHAPVALGDIPGCLSGSLSDPGPYMRSLHATILRVVVSPIYGQNGQALPCIRGARADGYKTVLVVQWDSRWSLRRTKSFFRQILGEYSRYTWALAIGNEQEITPRMSGAQYARAWRAVEPIVRRIAPWAIRVGGEISPWGLEFLRAALRAGLPGIQAVAVHPYLYSWSFSPSQALRLARGYGLPLWCDEGLYDGPSTWHPHQSRSWAAMRGAALVGVWLA